MTFKVKAVYEENRVLFSRITNRFFFCRRVKVLSETTREVAGPKYDITNDLQDFLKAKFTVDKLKIPAGEFRSGKKKAAKKRSKKNVRGK